MGGVISYVWPRGSFFWLFCGLAGYCSIVFLAIAVSSALYVMAELSEEYPSQTGVILKKILLPVVSALHVLLWFDGLPFTYCFIGLLCHASYYHILKTFPLVELTSPSSIAGFVAFIVNHYVWFQHFMDVNQRVQDQRYQHTQYEDEVYTPDFLHITGFFLLLVWLVPGGMFVSLNTSDSVLPSSGSSGMTNVGSSDHLGRGGGRGGGAQDNNNDGQNGQGESKGKPKNLFKKVYDMFQALVEKMASAAYTGASDNRKYSSNSSNNSNSNSNSYNSKGPAVGGIGLMGGGDMGGISGGGRGMGGVSSDSYSSNQSNQSNQGSQGSYYDNGIGGGGTPAMNMNTAPNTAVGGSDFSQQQYAYNPTQFSTTRANEISSGSGNTSNNMNMSNNTAYPNNYGTSSPSTQTQTSSVIPAAVAGQQAPLPPTMHNRANKRSD